MQKTETYKPKQTISEAFKFVLRSKSVSPKTSKPKKKEFFHQKLPSLKKKEFFEY